MGGEIIRGGRNGEYNGRVLERRDDGDPPIPSRQNMLYNLLMCVNVTTITA
jgi:hypothetical protein